MGGGNAGDTGTAVLVVLFGSVPKPGSALLLDGDCGGFCCGERTDWIGAVIGAVTR